MKRAVLLSLVLLLSIGVAAPFFTDWSEASKPGVQNRRKKIRKYSRAWWRIYRAKQRRARALAQRRAELAQRRVVLAKDAEISSTQPVPVLGNEAPPVGWNRQVAAGGNDVEFRVADERGQQIGSAQLTVVGAAMPEQEASAPERMRKQMLSGVSISALRRTVIDKMIKEEGYIVNDYQRDVNGKKVFVVEARSDANGATKSRLFYFTEVDGRIYSLSTNVPNELTEKVAADSEKVITAMIRNSTGSDSTVQTAANPR